MEIADANFTFSSRSNVLHRLTVWKSTRAENGFYFRALSFSVVKVSCTPFHTHLTSLSSS